LDIVRHGAEDRAGFEWSPMKLLAIECIRFILTCKRFHLATSETGGARRWT